MSAERSLVLDIGNTFTTCGLFEGKRLRRAWDCPTSALVTATAARRRWLRRLVGCRAERLLIVSVVPRAAARLVRLAVTHRLPRPLRFGRDIVPPIPNRYRRPEQVGADRLANAVGALRRYRTSAIVIDCGTALTVDLVDQTRGYLGGLIMPGLDLALWALAERTALLPRLTARSPKTLVGRETADSMLSGVVYGTAAACNDLVPRMSRHLHGAVTPVLTGGAAILLRPHLRFPFRHEPHLSLYGAIESLFDRAKHRNI